MVITSILLMQPQLKLNNMKYLFILAVLMVSCQSSSYTVSQKKLKKIERQRERHPKKGQDCPSFRN